MEQRSADIDATMDCLTALGAQVAAEPGGVSVIGMTRACENPLLDCGRADRRSVFCCPLRRPSAKRRALPAAEGCLASDRRACARYGSARVAFSPNRLPLSVTGKLLGGTYSLPGNVSSQYLTGLLLALPLLQQSSKNILTTRLESAAYVDLTLHALRRFRRRGHAETKRLRNPRQAALPFAGQVFVEGDWSNARFFRRRALWAAPSG
jgi:3-phosphoshikimate 1-carboxyvinyltransferase